MQSDKIIQDILNLKDLKPSNEVNSKFNSLVSLVINNPNLDQELTKEEIIKLQAICSQAESELEIYWSNKRNCLIPLPKKLPRINKTWNKITWKNRPYIEQK